MASGPATIESLPNEILISLFSSFSTASLLPLTAVNRRFHALTVRILRQRLADAARLPGHDLVLECYHPSAKTSTPYFYCDYLGTDGLDTVPDAGGSVGGADLASLRGLYSRFRPVVQDEARRPRSRYPMRAQQQQQPEQAGGAAQAGAPSQEPVRPSQDVHLDESELFSQLCTLTNVGKVGPKRGVYLSHVNVSDGVIRVWRDWLAARADEGTGRGKAAERDGEKGIDNPAILWADAQRSVGVRFRVVEMFAAGRSRPVLVGVEEDLPVSYRLEYEELLVRTRKLLLALEESEVLEVTHPGSIYINPRGPQPQPVQAFFWADFYALTQRPTWVGPSEIVGSA